MPSVREWTPAFRRYLAKRAVETFYLRPLGQTEGWINLCEVLMRGSSGRPRMMTAQEALDAALSDFAASEAAPE